MNSDDSAIDSDLIVQLQALIAAIEASGQVILPPTNHALLQSIVQVANRIFKAKATAIAVLTADGQELEFIAAFNIINQNILGMRFPTNRGIAGYVAMTGQPLIVSQVEEDARFNRSFAEQSGYIPQSILAVPLRLGETITGVIEVLDKVSGDSFTLQDIELLTLFAEQASLTIEQATQWDQLQNALVSGLKQLVRTNETGSGAALIQALESQPPVDSDLLRLAEMIKIASALGPAERDACRQILTVFQSYSQTKPIHRFGVDRLK
jgi:GAF domain-containing protein